MKKKPVKNIELAIIITPDDYVDFKERLGDYVRWNGSTKVLNKSKEPDPAMFTLHGDPMVLYYNLHERNLLQSSIDYAKREKISTITYKEFIEDYGCPVL